MKESSNDAPELDHSPKWEESIAIAGSDFGQNQVPSQTHSTLKYVATGEATPLASIFLIWREEPSYNQSGLYLDFE